MASSNQDKNVTDVDFLTNFKDDYYDYGIDVIKNRALPDVRDGLKPVQRAILTEMLFSHITSKSKTVKVAKITGAVIGKWHPHGDSSVEDALAAMAAPWKNPMPAIEIKGNGGSVYGDRHAAGRYIEAKLSQTGDSYGQNLKPGVVPYEPNFDETLQMPKVLPAQLPYLLINGGEGIAVGLSSSIPTHNPAEVIKALIRYLKKPNLSVKQLMTTLKGPDFPTGGVITNADDLPAIYETGLGKIRIRGRMCYTKKDNSIHVYEIPYNFSGNMNNLVTELAQNTMETLDSKGKRIAPKIKGVIDVKDHSGKDGLDIQIKLRKGADPDSLMNLLFAKTRMETTFKVDLSALNDKKQKRYNLKSYFKDYTAFYDQILLNEYQLKLTALNDRLEVIRGLLLLKHFLDEIVSQARLSSGRKELETVLTTGKPIKGTPVKYQKTIKTFKFTKRQAEYIAGLPIYRLNKVDYQALASEGHKIIADLKVVKRIVEQKDKRLAIMLDRLSAALKNINAKRQTEITQTAQARVTMQEIPETKLYFTFDRYSYLRLAEKPFDDAAITTNKRRLSFIDENGICHNLFLDSVKPTPDTGSLLSTLIDVHDPIVGFTAQVETGGDVLYVFASGNCKLTPANKFMTKSHTRKLTGTKTKEKIIKVIDWPLDATAVTLNGHTFAKNDFSVNGPAGLGKHMIEPITDALLDLKWEYGEVKTDKPVKSVKVTSNTGILNFDQDGGHFVWDAHSMESNHLFSALYPEVLKQKLLFVHKDGRAKIVAGHAFKVASHRTRIEIDKKGCQILTILPVNANSKFVATFKDGSVKAVAPSEIANQGKTGGGAKTFTGDLVSVVDAPDSALPCVSRATKPRMANDWK